MAAADSQGPCTKVGRLEADIDKFNQRVDQSRRKVQALECQNKSANASIEAPQAKVRKIWEERQRRGDIGSLVMTQPREVVARLGGEGRRLATASAGNHRVSKEVPANHREG